MWNVKKKKKKEGSCECVVPASLSCKLLTQDIWADNMALDKSFVQKGVSTVDGSLIISRPFLF